MENKDRGEAFESIRMVLVEVAGHNVGERGFQS
jgi:hypothetical protein